MKNFILFLFALSISSHAICQNSNKEQVTKAWMNYLEGFYEGDTDKLKAA